MAKTITTKSSSFEGRHPRLGRISRARAWVDSVVDELGRDPLALVYCPATKRAELLAEILVVNVSRADLEAAAPGFSGSSRLEGLDRIDAVRKAVYDERTAVNRTAREKRTMAAELQKTLPPETRTHDDVGVLREEHGRLVRNLDSVKRRAEQARLNRVDTLKREAQAEIDRFRAEASAEVRGLEQRKAERIAEIERETAEAIRECGVVCGAKVDGVKAAAMAASEEFRQEEASVAASAEAELGPQIIALVEKIAVADVAAREHERAEKTREILAAAESGAVQAEEQSKTLSTSLQRLDDLRTRLLASLPIKGLEIREGVVYLDGIPFSRVNTARQIQVALQVASLRAKDVPLLISDHGEALDSGNWEALRSTAAALGMNIIIARRTDGPLAVETEQEVAA